MEKKWSSIMAHNPTVELNEQGLNLYEAIIVASKHARHLNAKRMAKLAQLEEGEAEIDIESRKMTAVALRDLLEGKVQFERSDTE
jgi:DNA-directed RNA polymerase subunit K/omega